MILAGIIAVATCIYAPVAILSGNVLIDVNTVVDLLLCFALTIILILGDVDTWKIAKNVKNLSTFGIILTTCWTLLLIIAIIGCIINF